MQILQRTPNYRVTSVQFAFHLFDGSGGGGAGFFFPFFLYFFLCSFWLLAFYFYSFRIFFHCSYQWHGRHPGSGRTPNHITMIISLSSIPFIRLCYALDFLIRSYHHCIFLLLWCFSRISRIQFAPFLFFYNIFFLFLLLPLLYISAPMSVLKLIIMCSQVLNMLNSFIIELFIERIK